MMDVRDHYLYSDKYTISAIELGQIKLATDEDRLYQIDQWVLLMNASTWGELKMIAHANPAMESAAESLFLSNEEYNVLKVARERAEALQERQRDKERIKKQASTITEQASTITEQASTITEQASTINELANEIAELKAQLAAKGNLR